MKNQKLAAIISTLVISSISLLAQPTAVQQLQSTTRTQEPQKQLQDVQKETLAPELFPGENEDVGPQHMLYLKPRKKYFEAIVDSQYLYTSNVRLAQNSEGSSLFINTVELDGTAPAFTLFKKEMNTRAGARFQWYNYGIDGSHPGLGAFDFHAQTAFLEESFSPAENWRVMAGMEATHLLSQPHYSEMYEELSPTLEVDRLFSFSSNKVFLASYKGFYRFTHTDNPAGLLLPALKLSNDRTDQTITLAYSQEIFPKLILQPVYQFQYTYFTVGQNRNDYLNTVGIFLTYNFNRYACVRTYVDYVNKQTDKPLLVSEYDKFDLGVGVTVDVHF